MLQRGEKLTKFIKTYYGIFNFNCLMQVSYDYGLKCMCLYLKPVEKNREIMCLIYNIDAKEYEYMLMDLQFFLEDNACMFFDLEGKVKIQKVENESE